MQGAACSGKAQNETTWPIFIIRIVFNHFTISDGLVYFGNPYPTQDSAINIMFGKFEIVVCYPLSDRVY